MAWISEEAQKELDKRRVESQRITSALLEHKRIMEEEVIPEIEKTIRERALARHRFFINGQIFY